MSSRKVVEECLAAIDRFEPQVRAWVMVDREGALREAERIQHDVESGNSLGPLAGVTIGVKDIIDVAGWPTKAASPLREQHIAERDAPVVAALRRAGAIILGKTVTTQFACFDPPPTRNPWNLQHTPGGSSSGSAVAVALGMCHAALGTQTGGSILRPAAYCGVVGFKPAYDSLDMRGIVPVSFHLDHVGVFARCVDDVACLWHVLQVGAGTWRLAADRIADPFNLKLPPEQGYFGGSELSVIHKFYLEERSHWQHHFFESHLDSWRKHGLALGCAEFLAPFEEVSTMHRRIMSAECARYHAHDFDRAPSAYLPYLAALIEEGRRVTLPEYMEALQLRREWRHAVNRLLSRCDALVSPTTPDDPPPLALQSTGDPRFNVPFSLSGHPAISLPCGCSPQGLPWGIQFVGGYQDEVALLVAAATCERANRPLPHPPLLDHA